jgi:hypothetical protein
MFIAQKSSELTVRYFSIRNLHLHLYCLDILSRLHTDALAVPCFATPSMDLETANPGTDRKRCLSPVTVTRIRVETVRYQPCAGEAAGAADWATDWATLQLFVDVCVAGLQPLMTYFGTKITELSHMSA